MFNGFHIGLYYTSNDTKVFNFRFKTNEIITGHHSTCYGRSIEHCRQGAGFYSKQRFPDAHTLL